MPYKQKINIFENIFRSVVQVTTTLQFDCFI